MPRRKGQQSFFFSFYRVNGSSRPPALARSLESFFQKPDSPCDQVLPLPPSSRAGGRSWRPLLQKEKSTTYRRFFVQEGGTGHLRLKKGKAAYLPEKSHRRCSVLPDRKRRVDGVPGCQSATALSFLLRSNSFAGCPLNMFWPEHMQLCSCGSFTRCLASCARCISTLCIYNITSLYRANNQQINKKCPLNIVHIVQDKRAERIVSFLKFC